MFKWPGFRFSLLTLLLVTTLAAVAVSHWRASRELARAELLWKAARDDAQWKQRTIRALNDELGRLTVDDETHVHVIAQKANSVAPFPRQYHVPWQSSFTWNAYLPAQTDWQVCWAGGELPAVGVPRVRTGQHLLRIDPTADRRVTLSATHQSPWESGLALVFRSGDDIWSGAIPRDVLAEFHADELIYSEVVGAPGRGGFQTVSFPPVGPIVLLRQYRASGDAQQSTLLGLAVWLEPVPKEHSEQASQ